MRLLADTNIAAPAVNALREDGHDVAYTGERPVDPGDLAILAESVADDRVLVTKDHDIGTLVFNEGKPHSGVLLIDDLGSAVEELALLRSAIQAIGNELASGAFVRAGASGIRVARST